MAFYDLLSQKYVDAEIQPARFKNEHETICSLADKQKIKNNQKLLIADRGLSSYNFYMHAEKVGASYLIRITNHVQEVCLEMNCSTGSSSLLT